MPLNSNAVFIIKNKYHTFQNTSNCILSNQICEGPIWVYEVLDIDQFFVYI